MAKVMGLGGIFVKTRDKARLVAFYRDALGMDTQDWGALMFADEGAAPGRDARAYSLWSPFDADTTYFAPSMREFMVNLRVDDLDAVLARAKGAGANVLERRETTPQGKFGYVVDPDGTLIELWEQAADDA